MGNTVYVIKEAAGPKKPQWVSGFVMFLIITGINLIGVKAFEEIEFWGAIIKVLAVIVIPAKGI